MPFFFVFGAKNKLGRRWSYQPGVIDNFLFQLIGSPAGIAQGDKIVFRTGAESDVGKNVDGGRNRNSVADDNAVAFEIIGGMQNKTTHLVQRATLIKVYGGNGFKRADRQLIGQIGEGELFNFFVYDKTHRPVFCMRANVYQRPFKPLVSHIRHRNQTFAGQVVFTGFIHVIHIYPFFTYSTLVF